MIRIATGGRALDLDDDDDDGHTDTRWIETRTRLGLETLAKLLLLQADCELTLLH